MQKIPTNLITGFLGAGKTSTVRSLLSQRPKGERWSVFVNEFGEVSIDQSLIDQTCDVRVKELGGGCLCCTMSYVMEPALAQFIRQSKPHRLLIEPSGAGHPAYLIDKLRGDNFKRVLDLRATICLVDPSYAIEKKWQESSVFQDQIQMADIVVINWSDCHDPEVIKECQEWIKQFDPPKLFVTQTNMGQLDPKWLDLNHSVSRPPLHGHAHKEELEKAKTDTSTLENKIQSPPSPGQPIRMENNSQGKWACGWIFSPEDIFNRNLTLDLLGHAHPILRIKGVFNCRDEWWSINRTGEQTSFKPTTYRRDSRLEIITDHPVSSASWQEFEQKLLKCTQEKKHHLSV